MTLGLDGLRILVVEDEYLVASLIQDFLEMAGCVVLGPIARLAEAADAAQSDSCDAALLDVNLGGSLVFPVAEILSHRRIPFAFVTGYATGSLPTKHNARPAILKPFRKDELLTLVSDMVNSAA
jgi:DNA-binding response OmpR family regulator